MKRKFDFCILFLLLFTLLCCDLPKEDWSSVEYSEMEHKTAKWDENIRYIFSSDVNVKDRNKVIEKSKKYIKDNLQILGESELKDSIEIIFVDDKKEMYKYTSLHVSGTVFDADKSLVFCVYDENRMPLKHELMHIISTKKWGRDVIIWLSEGLATYADASFSCDNYSLEEKYVAFLQKDKLVPVDSLILNFHGNIFTEDFNNNINKIRYYQSAYIVQYLIEEFGIHKIKELWLSDMSDFENIFGLRIENMLINIEKKLKEKYPEAIDFNWDQFDEPCF